MKLLLAGGGTGGHLIPGLAVAETVRRRAPDSQIWLFGTPRAIDRKLVPAAGIPLFEQVVQPFSTRPWRWPGFYLAWKRSCRDGRKFLRQNRPDVVLGLGGYAAAPAVVEAARLDIRTAILNPDAVPGRANRYLARRVDRVFCQWDVTLALMPQPQVCRVVGCPTRAGLADLDRQICRRALDLDADRPLLLITGASLGAGTINEAVPLVLSRIAGRLNEPWQVLHQTGTRLRNAECRMRNSEFPIPNSEFGPIRDPQSAIRNVLSYRAVDFIDRMDQAIAAADLVLCRAGASTLAELTAIGRPAVLLPYPYHRDQHQRHNGQVLTRAEAAVMLADRRQADANAAQLAGPLVELMNNDAKRRAMSEAARSLGRPAAADAVADELVRLVGGT